MPAMHYSAKLRSSLMAMTAVLLGSSIVAGADKPVTFEEHVQPIFRARCFSCHNTNKKASGLDLTSYSSTMLGGASGEVVDVGNVDDSYLFMLINHDSEPYMPPKADKMPANELALISKWIEQGALERAGSKPRKMKKKANLALVGAPTDRPAGPPPMPMWLSKEAQVVTPRLTAVTAIATSPWSSLVAVAGQEQVVLYDAANLELLGVLPFPEGEPNVLKFSRNGSLLMAAGGTGAALGKAIVWNVQTGERVIEVGDELDAVLAADISADQTMIAIGGSNRLVRIYSTADGTMLHELKKHTDWVYSLEFSPDGVLLATADRNGGMFMWEAFTGRLYADLRGHGAAITDVSWRSDSNILASVSLDGTLRMWEPENGKQVKTWKPDGAGVESVEFARDGRIMTAGRSRVPMLWDGNGKKLRDFEAFSDYALEVSYSDETNRVIAGDWNGDIRVWNAADGARLGTLTPNPPHLKDRLAAAQKHLNQVQGTHNTAAATAKQDNDALASVQKQSTDAAAALKQAEAAYQNAVKTRDTTKQNHDKLAADHAATGKRVTELKALVPLLTDSATKMKQAADQAKGDEALAKSASEVMQQKETKSAELTAAEKKLAELTPALDKAKKDLAAGEKAVVDTKAAQVANQKTVAGLVEPLKAAQAKATESNNKLAAATNQLNAAKQNVAKWTAEIDFHGKLVTLGQHKEKQSEVVAAFDVVAEELAQKEGELKQAQDGKNAAQAKLKAANDQVAANQAALTKATSDQQAGQTKVTVVEATLPQLDTTLKQAQQALTTSEGDTDLKAAVDQWQQLIAKKKQELEAHRTTLKNLTAALEVAKQTLATSQQQVTTEQTAMAAAQKMVEEKTAIVVPVKEKAAAAQKVVDEVNQLVASAQQAVDQMRQSTQKPPVNAAANATASTTK